VLKLVSPTEKFSSKPSHAHPCTPLLIGVDMNASQAQQFGSKQEGPLCRLSILTLLDGMRACTDAMQLEHSPRHTQNRSSYSGKPVAEGMFSCVSPVPPRNRGWGRGRGGFQRTSMPARSLCCGRSSVQFSEAWLRSLLTRRSTFLADSVGSLKARFKAPGSASSQRRAQGARPRPSRSCTLSQIAATCHL